MASALSNSDRRSIRFFVLGSYIMKYLYILLAICLFATSSHCWLEHGKRDPEAPLTDKQIEKLRSVKAAIIRKKKEVRNQQSNENMINGGDAHKFLNSENYNDIE